MNRTDAIRISTLITCLALLAPPIHALQGESSEVLDRLEAGVRARYHRTTPEIRDEVDREIIRYQEASRFDWGRFAKRAGNLGFAGLAGSLMVGMTRLAAAAPWVALAGLGAGSVVGLVDHFTRKKKLWEVTADRIRRLLDPRMRLEDAVVENHRLEAEDDAPDLSGFTDRAAPWEGGVELLGEVSETTSP